ncbi:MAG: AI-2E family transporter [Campylobacterota bacterium]|nr:AI-2E family transporter [Campylobacterota bacterium]
MNTTTQEDHVKLSIEIATKLGVLALAVLISYLILKPFIPIIVWGIIIAVAIAPVIGSLEKRFSNRKMVIIGFITAIILALILPTYALSGKMIASSQTAIQTIQNDNVIIPPPSQHVKEWPLVGEKLYELGTSASQDLKKTLIPFKEDIKNIIESLFSAMKSGLGTIFMFIGSLIIAAFLLISSKEATAFYQKVMRRLLGERGPEWANLSTLTVRSVVTGVLGVAVIQAVFALLGLVLMGIPFAIVWAVAIMFLTIIQVPALLIIGPIIAYVFSQGSGTPEVVFTVYMLIVGASDGVLKPMLMGRGVDIPMLVILIGAIGGMILMGMIGLFVGAVILALTYKLFGLWMSEIEEETAVNETS